MHIRVEETLVDNLQAQYFHDSSIPVFVPRQFIYKLSTSYYIIRRRTTRRGLKAENHLDLILVVRAKAANRREYPRRGCRC